jgi:hypothetical protein
MSNKYHIDAPQINQNKLKTKNNRWRELINITVEIN